MSENRSNILTIAFIIIVLCGLIVVFLTIGNWGSCIDCGPRPNAYYTAREQIQTAVTAHQANQSNNGSLPTFGNTTWNGTCTNLTAPLYIVNLSQLLTVNGGILRTMPSGVYGSDSAGCDNCGGSITNDSVYGCENSSHYLWVMDQYGTVASICIGKGCKAANVSGYQSVWP